MSAGFANPFSVLVSRNAHTVLKDHGAGSKEKRSGKEKVTLPREPRAVKVRAKDDQKKDAPEDTLKEAPKKEPSKKEARAAKNAPVVQEATKPQEKTEKEIQKEQHLEDKIQKVENSRTDRRDRSGKGNFVRKEGKGTGGWDETSPSPEDTAPPPEQPADEGPSWGAASAEPEAPAAAPAEPPMHDERARELSEEERKRREDEAKARELEEKQMTLDEYMEKLKKDKAAEKSSFNIRTVDKAPLANMIQKKHKEDQVLRINSKKPPTPQAKPKPQPAAETKKAEKGEKKLDLAETGFRMDNPAVRGGRGGGRGDRGGREGGRGRGFGRGRGPSREGAAGAAVADDHSAPQMDSEALFPALRSSAPAGGSPTAAVTAEKAAEPAA